MNGMNIRKWIPGDWSGKWVLISKEYKPALHGYHAVWGTPNGMRVAFHHSYEYIGYTYRAGI